MNLRLASEISILLRDTFGVYAGDHSERSVREAGATLYNGTGRAAGYIYGHWLLRSGELTVQLKDHAKSALEILPKAIPGYRPKGDPIVDLMNYSAAIRVRHAPPVASIVDMVHQPTALQRQALAQIAKAVEDKSGYFQWSVLNHNDTNTLGDGNGYEELASFKWPKTAPVTDETE